jgi:XrtJ-associated TM-motif-TM protein
MKKLMYIVPVVLAALAVSVPAVAQSGCTDSPENPTAVLGLVVGAASLGYMHLRNRFGLRKK